MIYTIFFTSLCIYLIFVFYLALGLLRPKPSTAQRIHPPISIVVVARNEAKNISRCLESLIQQDYPADQLEIIFMDDQSDDGTTKIASSMARTFPGIRIFSSNDTQAWKSGKKRALQVALAKASGTVVFLTDADCSPPPAWIKSMLVYYHEDTGLVAGFSPQTSPKGFLWNHFLIIDSMAAAFVASGSIGWGNGVTCTGRNLSLRLKAFQETGGYTSTPDSLSGDDDFMLQKINTSAQWTAAYAFGKNSVIPADGPLNFMQFIRQKTRHISAGKHFHLTAKACYALFHATNLILWFSLFCALLSNSILIFFWIAKVSMDFAAIKIFSKKVEYKFSMLAFLPWEVAFALYHLLASPMTIMEKRKW